MVAKAADAALSEFWLWGWCKGIHVKRKYVEIETCFDEFIQRMHCLREAYLQEDSNTRVCMKMTGKSFGRLRRWGRKWKEVSQSPIWCINHGHNEGTKQERSHGGKLCSLLQVTTVGNVNHTSALPWSCPGSWSNYTHHPTPWSLAKGIQVPSLQFSAFWGRLLWPGFSSLGDSPPQREASTGCCECEHFG